MEKLLGEETSLYLGYLLSKISLVLDFSVAECLYFGWYFIKIPLKCIYMTLNLHFQSENLKFLIFLLAFVTPGWGPWL